MRKLLFFVLTICSFSRVNAAAIDIDFFVDGNTYSQDWVITNNSTSGFLIEEFVFDLRPLAGNGLCFDDATVGTCHSSSGTDFTVADPVAANDAGYLGYSLTDAPGGIAEFDFLSILFDDFGTGDSFSWNIDVDDNAQGIIFGDDLIGASVFVLMSDGNVYSGSLEAEGGSNLDASRFVISEVTDEPIDDVTGISEPWTFGLFSALLLIGMRRASIRR